MAEFKKVQITEAVAEGFKGFKDKTVISFEEGKSTFVGDNEFGKSSIGELLVWVLTGKNIQGKQKDLNIINKDSDLAIGTISFKDEDGEIHQVERKLNTTTTLKFDNKRTTQKQLEELIPTELFLLIFNPLYFLSLDADASRKTIYSLLPGVKKEDVLAELNAKEKAFLEGEHFDIQNTNEYLKNRRKELKDIEDQKKYVKGYMAKLDEKVDIPASMSFDDKKIEAVEKQLETLSAKKPELKSLTDLLFKKSELEKQINEIKGNRFESEKVMLELQNEKSFLEQQIKAETEKEYSPLNVSSLETEIAVLRNDYRNANTQYKALASEGKALDKKKSHFHEGDQCPTCKQTITKNVVKVLNGEVKKQVDEEKAKISKKQNEYKKTLAELEQEGKTLLEKITKSKEEDELKRKKFEEEKQQKLASLQAQLKEITNKLDNLTQLEMEFKKEQQISITKLNEKIEALQLDKLEKENALIQQKFDTEVAKERATLQNTLTALRKEKEAVVQNETNRLVTIKRVEDSQKELENKKVELASYEKKEAKINNQISNMKVFNAQKIAIMNRTLLKHLKNTSLKLEKTVQTTGEIKDCFDVLYKNKELKICSTSETIKAGLEISNMIRELSGLDYPIFVDNGESITSYEETASQMIETKVMKDKKLSILKGGKEVEVLSIPKTKLKITSVVDDDEFVVEAVAN